MRSLTVTGVVALAILWTALPVMAQGAADAPAFVVGANKAYCHTSADGNTIWMNSLADDGDGTTYNVFGDPTFVDPALGIGFDPVQDVDFEIRIPLSPAAAGFVIQGTVSAQAFLGSGAYGGGQGTVGTSLVVDGTEVGAAAAVDHTMQPHNSNAGGTGPYEELAWTFDVPATTVPAGGLLEWVISGHIDFGNNIFLSCFEGRGRSNVDIPVTALGAGSPGTDSGGSNSTTNSTSSTVSVSSSSSTSSTSTSSTSTTSMSSSSTSRSSTSTAADGEQDAPAPPLALAGLAVLAAAFVVRRRLR